MSPGSPFKAGEKVFCYQGPLLYEAKILSLRLEKDKTIKRLFVHYNGWSKKWDEWVSEDRVFRINDETIQKKRELESAQKKTDRIKALKKSSRKVVGKRKVSQTQENASQQNGLNPKSTCSTKRKRTSTRECDNESENSENEDFTKVWKGCQASKGKNGLTREQGVPFEPCPECNERQIVEAFRYKSIHKQAEQKTAPHRDIIIWFNRLKDLGFELTSIPNISSEVLKCDICHRLYPDKETLKRHKQRHPHMIPDRRHKCPKCPYSTDKSTNIQKHLLTHDLPTFSCPTCNKLFTLAMNLKKHIFTHSREVLKCDICHRLYPDKETLKRHKQRHPHMIPDRRHKCPKCPYSTDKSTSIQKHLLTHDLPTFSCPTCNKLFTLATNLKKHIFTHSREKTFQCPTCSKTFRRSTNLREHVNSVHSSSKLFQCSQCEKTFATW